MDDVRILYHALLAEADVTWSSVQFSMPNARYLPFGSSSEAVTGKFLCLREPVRHLISGCSPCRGHRRPVLTWIVDVPSHFCAKVVARPKTFEVGTCASRRSASFSGRGSRPQAYKRKMDVFTLHNNQFLIQHTR